MRGVFFGLIVGVCAALLASPVRAMPAVPSNAFDAHPTIVPVEFWCSPGFEPRGGACVATLSRDELLIYERDEYVAPRRHRRSRHGLRELY